MAVAGHHLLDGWLCPVLFRAQELRLRNAVAWRGVWDYQYQFRCNPQPRRHNLRPFQVRERHHSRQDGSPLASCHRARRLLFFQSGFRLVRQTLHPYHRPGRRSRVREHDGHHNGHPASAQQCFPRLRIPSLQPSACLVGASQGTCHQDGGVEYLAFDRRSALCRFLRICHSPHRQLALLLLRARGHSFRGCAVRSAHAARHSFFRRPARSARHQDGDRR